MITKEQANSFFLPASEHKKLKGEYIVWHTEELNYYTSHDKPNARETKYNCGLVTKKQGDMLITTKFDRVPVMRAYVVSIELAAKWPQWDEVLGNKKITRVELMVILESLMEQQTPAQEV